MTEALSKEQFDREWRESEANKRTWREPRYVDEIPEGLIVGVKGYSYYEEFGDNEIRMVIVRGGLDADVDS